MSRKNRKRENTDEVFQGFEDEPCQACVNYELEVKSLRNQLDEANRRITALRKR